MNWTKVGQFWLGMLAMIGFFGFFILVTAGILEINRKFGVRWALGVLLGGFAILGSLLAGLVW